MCASGSRSEKTPLCGIACQKIIAEVFAKNNVPEGVSCLVQGGREIGEWLSNDTNIPLVSATGSTRMGKAVSSGGCGTFRVNQSLR
jgi:aldehyde dehydrogenase (NAD+)